MNNSNKYSQNLPHSTPPRTLVSSSYCTKNQGANCNLQTVTENYGKMALRNQENTPSPNHPRKDLFRAYLDVRQHSSAFENSKANYLTKMTDTAPRPHHTSDESTGEYFSGGQKGIHSTAPTFKMVPRPTRERNNNNHLPSSTWFACETPTLEEIDLKRNDIRSSLGREKEATADLSAFQYPHLIEKAIDEQNKENRQEVTKNENLNTFENIFGGRYDEKGRSDCNETYNNHIDCEHLQSIQLDDDPPLQEQNLYRMATCPVRCAMWRKENDQTARVMNARETDEKSLYGSRGFEDIGDAGFLEAMGRGGGRDLERSSSRIEEIRKPYIKPSRNTVLNNIEDSNSFIKKVSQKNAVVTKLATNTEHFQNSLSDPFDTKSWFKNNTSFDAQSSESFVHPTLERAGRQNRVVPVSDPLSVTREVEPCNSARADFNPQEFQSTSEGAMMDTEWSGLSSLVRERLDYIKPHAHQAKGLKRSECNWFRDKHVYNREHKNNFRPECHYSFSYTTDDPAKKS